MIAAVVADDFVRILAKQQVSVRKLDVAAETEETRFCWTLAPEDFRIRLE